MLIKVALLPRNLSSDLFIFIFIKVPVPRTVTGTEVNDGSSSGFAKAISSYGSGSATLVETRASRDKKCTGCT
jgi:hypothetical protein